jgi:hypothetical protein
MQVRTFTYTRRSGSYFSECKDTYGNYTSMDAHIQMLMSEGWEPMVSANDTGHVRLGKTLVLGALTGGASLLFGASRTEPTITLTFKKPDVGGVAEKLEARFSQNDQSPITAPHIEGPNVDNPARPKEDVAASGFCVFCRTKLRSGTAFCCPACSASQSSRSAASAPLEVAVPPRTSDDTHCRTLSAAGEIGQSAGMYGRYVRLNPKTAAMILAVLGFIAWWLLMRDENHGDAQIQTAMPPASNAGIVSPQGVTTASSSAQSPSHNIRVDLPILGFVRQSKVNSVLGAPRRIDRDANMMTWSQGTITTVLYSRAECTFLRDHLVSITYKFKVRPKTAEDALEWIGLPREAAFLDNQHPSHLPFRATYAPNPAHSNPVRGRGLLLQWVSMPEDGSEIQINFANINERYADWPKEIQSAWLRAGGQLL